MHVKKNTSSSNSSGCTTGTIDESRGYFPNNANTQRSYDYNEFGIAATLTHTTGTDTKVVNGKTYQKIAATINNTPDKNIYITESAGNFYSNTAVQVTGIEWPSNTQSNNDNQEILFLKSNDPVGSLWYVNLNRDIDEDPTRCRFKILSKGTSHEVNGKTYDNVITLEEVIESTCSSGCNYIDDRFVNDSAVIYFAKGVGIIEYTDHNYIAGGNFAAQIKCYDIR